VLDAVVVAGDQHAPDLGVEHVPAHLDAHAEW
jgi:hypothetical protein